MYLNSAYESTSVIRKKPFTEENLREVLSKYNEQYDDNVSMTVGEDGIVSFSEAKEMFCLVNLIDMTIKDHNGFKQVDGLLYMPLNCK